MLDLIIRLLLTHDSLNPLLVLVLPLPPLLYLFVAIIHRRRSPPHPTTTRSGTSWAPRSPTAPRARRRRRDRQVQSCLPCNCLPLFCLATTFIQSLSVTGAQRKHCKSEETGAGLMYWSIQFRASNRSLILCNSEYRMLSICC